MYCVTFTVTFRHGVLGPYAIDAAVARSDEIPLFSLGNRYILVELFFIFFFVFP